MRPNDLRFAGAVPLDPRPTPPPSQAAPAADGAHVIDVTEQTFMAEVTERSATIPVIVDLWAEWCGPCKQLSPLLERLAAEAQGSWILAKVDVDANPGLAQAFRVQGIPAVKAVWGKQLIDEFTGALPEQQIRAWLAGVLQTAGVQAPEAPMDPAWEQAQQRLEAGDVAGARELLTDLVARDPGDKMAVEVLANLTIQERVLSLDPQAVLAGADAQPDDVSAQCDLADVLFVTGRMEDAIALLVDVVRRTGGDERTHARTHLLGLFDAMNPEDPRLIAGRRALTSALF